MTNENEARRNLHTLKFSIIGSIKSIRYPYCKTISIQIDHDHRAILHDLHSTNRRKEWIALLNKILEAPESQMGSDPSIRPRLQKVAGALQDNLVGFEIAVDALLEIAERENERSPDTVPRHPGTRNSGLAADAIEKENAAQGVKREADAIAAELRRAGTIDKKTTGRTGVGHKSAPRKTSGRG